MCEKNTVEEIICSIPDLVLYNIDVAVEGRLASALKQSKRETDDFHLQDRY